jgi:hypothetical protein
MRRRESTSGSCQRHPLEGNVRRGYCEKATRETLIDFLRLGAAVLASRAQWKSKPDRCYCLLVMARAPPPFHLCALSPQSDPFGDELPGLWLARILTLRL